MNTKIPAIIFLVLGILCVSFSKHITAGITRLDGKIWNEKRRNRFPGHGGTNYKPWMTALLGASWIACAIFFWFTSK
jgi:hypothetical protein